MQKIINNNSSGTYSSDFPFFPFNRSKVSHSLAKSVARQRKGTYTRFVEVASSRLCKNPQLISKCLNIHEFC